MLRLCVLLCLCSLLLAETDECVLVLTAEMVEHPDMVLDSTWYGAECWTRAVEAASIRRMERQYVFHVDREKIAAAAREALITRMQENDE